MPTLTKPNVTPLYVLAGAGDLAVEKLRVLSDDLTTRVVALKDQPQRPYQVVQTELNKRFEAITTDAKTVPSQLRELPNTFQARVNTVVEQAEATYDDLAGRGKDLVTRIRKQRATEDLAAQATTTVRKAKATRTSARKSADAAQSSAKATATSARKTAKSAAKAAESAATKIGD
jgi:heparin binding hemagglutinin HbhA